MTAKEFLPYYQGQIQTIVVTCNQGLRLQLPAMHIRPYLKSNGVNGYFCLHTENNKFISLTEFK